MGFWYQISYKLLNSYFSYGFHSGVYYERSATVQKQFKVLKNDPKILKFDKIKVKSGMVGCVTFIRKSTIRFDFITQSIL